MPKIAGYEFTTLHPHLGKIVYEDFKEIVVEDLPGLIEKAHLNKGLGHRFLKHVERAKMLIYLLDVSNNPEWKRNPADDFKILRNELLQYDNKFVDKPFIVVLNKVDITDKDILKKNIENVKNILKGTDTYLLEISAKNGDNINKLSSLIRHLMSKLL